MKRFALLTLLSLTTVTTALRGDEAQTSATTEMQKIADIELTDICGKLHSPFSQPNTMAVALVFVTTDCPIANSVQPELRRIHQQFAAKNIDCFMVYCSPKLTQQQVEQHVTDYKIEMPAVLDSSQTISRLVKAKVTPEAVVVDRKGQIRYRGLINNLYAGYGKKRPVATEHYLRDALNSLRSGTPISVTKTKPLGCFIRYAND